MSIPRESEAMPTADGQATGELRDVVRMAVPLVIATSTRMLMDVTDYVMIKWVGSDAQAALLPAQLTVFSYTVLGMGILSMVNTLAAQSFGRRRYADCSAYAWQGMYLSVVLAVLGCGLWPLLPPLFEAVGHEPAIRALELDYTRVAVLTIGPTLGALAVSGFFNGIHRPLVTMWSAVEGLLVNAVVSYALIFGVAGLPKLGVEGAAYGTLVGCCYRMVRLLIAMCGPSYAEPYEARRTWRWDGAKTRTILRVGLPTGLQWVSDVVVWWVFVTILVGRFFGTDHLIASNSAWQYMRIAFVPCLGLGMALTAMVGKAIGRGDKERAVRVTRIALWLTMAYMGVFSLLYLVAGGRLIGLLNSTPRVVHIGGGVMICAAIFQLFDGLGIVYNSALRGAGDTFWPSMLFVVAHWVILVGGGWAVAHYRPGWGSIGPWLAASVLLIVIGIALWWRWNSRRWMTIDLFAHERPAVSA